ncbi:cell division protein FtsA [bacterium]|nr:cell division protein FtsA [candidate division CSSED10-310 bacterium]
MKIKGKLLIVDPGSRFIRMGVLEFHSDGAPELIFMKAYPSGGLNNGTVSSRKELADALRQAYESVRGESGSEQFGEIWVGHSGQHIRSDNATEESKIRHNVPVTARLEKQMLARAEMHIPSDYQLLHSFQQFSSLDGVRMRSAVGLVGTNLLSRYHLVFSRKAVINNIRAVFKDAGMAFARFVFNGYAAALSVCQSEEMNLGCLVIHLGQSTIDYVVFQEGQPFMTGSINDGWHRVIKDVAMGVHISIDNAEKVMVSSGNAHDIDAEQDGPLNVTTLFGDPSRLTRRQLAMIMSSSIEEVFAQVRDQLKNSICRGHLPGGVYLTGGGALTRGITYAATGIFGVQTRVEYPLLPWSNREFDPGWAPIIGMVREASEKASPVKPSDGVLTKIVDGTRELKKRMFPNPPPGDPEGEPEK